MAVLKE